MKNIICHEILDINKEGIVFIHKKKNITVKFEECATNFAMENSLKNSFCVATRDVTKLMFTFYTIPKTQMNFKKSFIKDLFLGNSARCRFLDLEKKIRECGYTSYDLS